MSGTTAGLGGDLHFLDRGPRALLGVLKAGGPMDARTVGEALGITAAAARQHLEALRIRGVVAFATEGRAIGRPARVWRLTAEAAAYFFNGHAGLTGNLLDAVQEEWGREGLRRVLDRCEQSREADYAKRLTGPSTLGGKLRALAALRTEEGYDAQLERADGESWALRQRHCPVAAAARRCKLLCECELDLFQRVLGNTVEVRRSEHLLNGDAACTYVFRPAQDTRSARAPAVTAGD